MKYCLIRERSLVMPGRGLEEISKGQHNFLDLMGGGGGWLQNITIQENIHIPIITWIFSV